MNRTGTLSAKIDLPCVARLNGADGMAIRGVTEEIARRWLIVVLPTGSGSKWLRIATNILIGVDLPCAGRFTPRILECAATVSHIETVTAGIRMTAGIHRMKILDYEAGTGPLYRHYSHVSTCEFLTAVPRPQNSGPVILRNHSTDFTSTQGEHNMSFLKNLFIEEDGQDMVEYGLVIALVVIASVAILTGFKTNIGTAFTAIGTDVTTNIK